jgi:hypothetical protein
VLFIKLVFEQVLHKEELCNKSSHTIRNSKVCKYYNYYKIRAVHGEFCKQCPCKVGTSTPFLKGFNFITNISLYSLPYPTAQQKATFIKQAQYFYQQLVAFDYPELSYILYIKHNVISHIQLICMYESKQMLAGVHPKSTEQHMQTKEQHTLQVTYDT